MVPRLRSVSAYIGKCFCKNFFSGARCGLLASAQVCSLLCECEKAILQEQRRHDDTSHECENNLHCGPCCIRFQITVQLLPETYPTPQGPTRCGTLGPRK